MAKPPAPPPKQSTRREAFALSLVAAFVPIWLGVLGVVVGLLLLRWLLAVAGAAFGL